MLLHNKTFIPAFDLPGHTDQYPLCFYVVLSINEKVGDCAAYHGIGPTQATPELIEKIRAGGNKISEAEARSQFHEIKKMGLRYRP